MPNERAKMKEGSPEQAEPPVKAPRKKAERASRSEVPSRSERPDDGRRLRIFLLLAAWAGAAIYLMDAINAAALIALAALLGLLYWRTPEGDVRPRRMLGAGAVLLLAGLAVVGIGTHQIGMGLTLLALLVMAFGIHTFGRLGPEETAPGA